MSEFEYLMDYARQNGEIAALKNAADTIETLRGELNKIANIIPSREDISVVDDALAYVREIEAQCAVMRECLGWINQRAGWDKYESFDGMFIPPEDAHVLRDKVKKALSSSAGHDLLERLKRLKVVAEAVRDILDSIDEFFLEGGIDGFDGCYIDVAELRRLRDALNDLGGW